MRYGRFYTIETKDSLDKFVNTITPALEDNYHSNVLSSSFLSYVGKIKEKDFKKYFYIIWSSPCRIETSSPTAEKMYYEDSCIYINIQADLLDETDARTFYYFFISKLKIDFYRVKSFTLNLKVNYKNSEDQFINTYNYSTIYSERIEYLEGIEDF